MVNVDLYSAIITKVSNAITVTNISQCFCLQDGGKNRLAQVWKKITSLSPCVYLKAKPLHRRDGPWTVHRPTQILTVEPVGYTSADDKLSRLFKIPSDCRRPSPTQFTPPDATQLDSFVASASAVWIGRQRPAVAQLQYVTRGSGGLVITNPKRHNKEKMGNPTTTKLKKTIRCTARPSVSPPGCATVGGSLEWSRVQFTLPTRCDAMV